MHTSVFTRKIAISVTLKSERFSYSWVLSLVVLSYLLKSVKILYAIVITVNSSPTSAFSVDLNQKHLKCLQGITVKYALSVHTHFSLIQLTRLICVYRHINVNLETTGKIKLHTIIVDLCYVNMCLVVINYVHILY